MKGLDLLNISRCLYFTSNNLFVWSQEEREIVGRDILRFLGRCDQNILSSYVSSVLDKPDESCDIAHLTIKYWKNAFRHEMCFSIVKMNIFKSCDTNVDTTVIYHHHIKNTLFMHFLFIYISKKCIYLTSLNGNNPSKKIIFMSMEIRIAENIICVTNASVA